MNDEARKTSYLSRLLFLFTYFELLKRLLGPGVTAMEEPVDILFKHSVGTMPWGPVVVPFRATHRVQPSSN